MRRTSTYQPPIHGLCLASGGARGAYQAGALLALAERGERYDRIIGTSIGALNGAFYAQSDGSVGAMLALCDLWRELPTVLKPHLSNLARLVSSTAPALVLGPFAPTVIAPSIPYLVWRLHQLSQDPSWSALDNEPLRAMLREWLHFDQLKRTHKEFIITTYNTRVPASVSTGFLSNRSAKNVAYQHAKDMTHEELECAILASAAIPFLFPAQAIRGYYHNDAGVGVEAHATHALVHRFQTPRVTTILLKQNDPAQEADYGNNQVSFVRPSTEIATRLSGLNFDKTTIERLICLGYEDAHRHWETQRGAA